MGPHTEPCPTPKSDFPAQLFVISGVSCAGQYTVWARYHDTDDQMEDHDDIWEEVGVTSKTYFHHSTLPCTEYQYGVSVTVGDQVSDIVSLETRVVTSIDTSDIYSPPDLIVNATMDGGQLTWSHRKCIDSYRVRSCTRDSAECYESTVITNDTIATHTLTNLRPCSQYMVTIHPSTRDTGEVSAKPMLLNTLPPPAMPPTPVEVILDIPGDKVDISCPQVECATGYR